MPHKARSFRRLPGPDEAGLLLRSLTAAPCSYAPVPLDKPLALYGAGKLGCLARDFLRAVGHDFVMALDRDARGPGGDFGAALMRPEDVPKAGRGSVRVAVSVVTSPYVPIEHDLLKLGFPDVVPFYDVAEGFRHVHPLSNGWFAPPLSAEDEKDTADVLARWGDDVSRAHHLQFLAWRRLREEWTFEPAPPSVADRFFIPEITGVLHDDEIFIDAGAHHGEVAEALTAYVNSSFAKIIAIEPDPANRGHLEARLRALMPNDPCVSVHDFALGESDSETRFHAGLDYASQLSPTGQMRVAVRQLDALGVAPSFIKLHLEGAELAALKGAQQTLAASRPIVAATVYHNADGIWKTPLWLMETLPDYHFLFRAHSWCGTGAVVYAIPQERTRRA